MKRTHPFLFALTALGMMSSLSTTGHAQSTWKGSTSANWGVAANWLNSLPPAEGENVIIDDATTNGLTLDTSHAIGSLTFGTTGTRNTTFTLTTGTGNTLTMNSGLTAVGITGTPPKLTMRGNFNIGTTQTWTVSAPAGLEPVNQALGSVHEDRGVMVRGNTDTTLGSMVLNGDMVKEGDGQLALLGLTISGAGNFVVNGGALKLNAGGSSLLTVGGTGKIIVNNSAQLWFSKNSGTFSISRAIEMNGTSRMVVGGGQGGTNVIGAVQWNGTHTLDANANNADTLYQFQGNWTGTGTVNKEGTRLIQLLGNNSGWSGTFNLRVGTVAAGNNNALGTGVVDFYGGTLASSDTTAREFTNLINFNTNSVFGTATTGDLKFTGEIRTGNNGGSNKNITVNNSVTEFSGVMTGNTDQSTLNKLGAGTLLLSGSSTTRKLFNLNDGMTMVTGNYSSITHFNLAAAGNLGGTGSVSLIQGAGRVSPGLAGAVGTLTATQITPTGGVDFDLSMTTASLTASTTGNDVLNVTGSINGSFTSDNTFFVDFTGAALAWGQIYYGGLRYASDFSSLLPGANFTYTGTAGFDILQSVAAVDGGSAYAMSFTVVPEPGRAMLLGLAGLVCVLRRRR